MVGQRPLEPYIQVRILVSQLGSYVNIDCQRWIVSVKLWGRSVVVNMPACQAGDRGFKSRRSRSK